MALKECNFCENEVPQGGQCNGCGFVDGLQRPPSMHEFQQAQKINAQQKYEQYMNIDMLVLNHLAESR